MANACCINAFDKQGTIVCTLGILKSEDIGQDIACRLPDINNTEVDYILYTDKCGCCCCLTGENEIIIHTAQGEIKTLNQSGISLKWSEIFGANWYKTMIRYKSDGYPQNISDGNLLVEEFVQNQYSSNGYSLDSLSGSYVYITAFAIDTNNNIISQKQYYAQLKKYIRFLLVGGGGAGSYYFGGGGGAGGLIQCSCYAIQGGTYPVVIGTGGATYTTCCDGVNGGNSTFNGLTAYGGGGGGGYSSRPGHPGGSGGGDGYHNGTGGGVGCTGQGNKGGNHVYNNSSGGGGGAGGAGFDGQHQCLGGYGGCGIQSDISGTTQWYASGGDGHNGYNCCNYQGSCVWCPALSGARAESNATTYGGGGGGVPGTCTSYGHGKQGIFIVSYPTACGYNITGGTKYTCGSNTIHCFTSNGNLVVS